MSILYHGVLMEYLIFIRDLSEEELKEVFRKSNIKGWSDASVLLAYASEEN